MSAKTKEKRKGDEKLIRFLFARQDRKDFLKTKINVFATLSAKTKEKRKGDEKLISYLIVDSNPCFCTSLGNFESVSRGLQGRGIQHF